MNLHEIKTLLIDGDGVLWRASEPVPGINTFFDSIARRNIRWALVTNNATRTVEMYLSKLAKFGVEAQPGQVFTSATVTAERLSGKYEPGTSIYVIGEKGIRHYLAEKGFSVHTGDQLPEIVDAVVVGMDTEITFRKLAVATLAIRRGAGFYATNPDRTFPTPEGLVPGAGSIVAALVAATDVTPEVIGKPQPAIFEAAVDAYGGEHSTTAMIGDRLETDILGAKNTGIGTIAVLSGVTSPELLAASDIQPNLVFPSILELAHALDSLS